MNLLKKIPFKLLISLLFFSCSKNSEDDLLSKHTEQHFILESKTSVLPVEVNGNTQSKTFIIFSHTGKYDHYFYNLICNNEVERLKSKLKSLQENVAIVYWVQRCSNGTNKTFCEEENTLKANEQDLDFLVQTLKLRYGQDISVFLLGHGWGATLALSYLANQSYDHSLIKGNLVLGGTHNASLMFLGY